MTARKLTRKALLRQDEFLTTMDKTQQFWEEHRNAILIGVAGVAAVAILTVGGISFFQAREAKAATALAEALRPYHGSVLGQQAPARAPADQMQFSSTAEKYQQAISAMDGVIDDFGSTESGRMARLYRGHALFNLGRYSEALEEYQSFRDTAGHGYLSGLALLNMANCRKMSGDIPAALAAGQELIDTAAQLQFPLDTALCAQADCFLESGNGEEAAGLYRRLMEEFPESAYRFVAEEKLGSLDIDPAEVTAVPGALTLE